MSNMKLAATMTRMLACARPGMRPAALGAARCRFAAQHTAPVRLFASQNDAPSQSTEQVIKALRSEINYEQEQGDDAETAAATAKDLSLAGWAVNAPAGSVDVTLTKEFQGELITVKLSLADAYQEEEDAFDEDVELDGERTVPVHLDISITKPGGGALFFEASVRDAFFTVLNMSYYENPDHALSTDPAVEAARSSLYDGPPFQSLEEGVQESVALYLEERGFDARLAELLPQYIQVKEQVEYLSWLGKVEEFFKK